MSTSSRAVRVSAAAVLVVLSVGLTSCSGNQQPAAGGAPSSAGGSATATSSAGAGSASAAPSGSAAASSSGAPTGSATASRSAGAGKSATAGTSATAGRSATGSRTTTGTVPPPATTPVPPPSPGTVTQTVAPRKEVTKPPVKLGKPSRPTAGTSVKITSVKAITAKAQLPGEVAGPAVALTVTVKNGGTKPMDLSAVVVTLTDSSGAPGSEMTAKPAKAFSGRLAKGRTATGVYVFTVAKSRRSPVSVLVTLAGETPVLLFKGDVR